LTKFKTLLKPDIIGLSFLVSAIIAFMDIFTFPVFFKAATKSADAANPMFNILMMIVAFVVVLHLFSLLLIRVRIKLENKDRSKITKIFIGLIIIFFIGLVAMFLISLIYGLLSVLIYQFTHKTLTVEQVKGIINVITGLLTLLILPVFINILLTFGLNKSHVKESIFTGIKTLKFNYLKFLLIIFSLFGVGYLAMIPLNYIPSTGVLLIVKALLLSLIGTIGIIIAFTAYKGGQAA